MRIISNTKKQNKESEQNEYTVKVYQNRYYSLTATVTANDENDADDKIRELIADEAVTLDFNESEITEIEINSID